MKSKAITKNHAFMQRLVILVVVIVLYLFFYAMSTSFRRYTTLIQICNYMYYILLMAIGVTFPLITGGVDLSMGTGLICYSVIGSYMIRINGWPVWAAMVLELPPFIVTLATMMCCRGMGSILTNNYSGT